MTLTEPLPLSTAELFRPFALNGVSLANRIVMAPMTRNHSPDGVPGADVAAYYRRRAEGGVGLILTEGTAPNHPQAKNMPNVPQIYGSEALAGWTQVVDGVHEAGGKIFSQIWHVGAVQGPGGPPKLPASPDQPLRPAQARHENRRAHDASRYRRDDRRVRAGSRVGAARRLRRHRNPRRARLSDRPVFLGRHEPAARTNTAAIFSARTRFAVEIIRECRRRAGPSFPILLRFSQWKLQDYAARLATTPQELARFLEPLAAAGLDAFHCSTRRFWEPEFEGSDLNLAGWTKKITGMPTITVGSVSLGVDFIDSFRGAVDPNSQSDGAAGRAAHMDRLLEMFARGDFDLVAVGRALLADSTWAAKVRDGHLSELRPFTPEVLKTLD